MSAAFSAITSRWSGYFLVGSEGKYLRRQGEDSGSCGLSVANPPHHRRRRASWPPCRIHRSSPGPGPGQALLWYPDCWHVGHGAAAGRRVWAGTPWVRCRSGFQGDTSGWVLAILHPAALAAACIYTETGRQRLGGPAPDCCHEARAVWAVSGLRRSDSAVLPVGNSQLNGTNLCSWRFSPTLRLWMTVQCHRLEEFGVHSSSKCGILMAPDVRMTSEAADTVCCTPSFAVNRTLITRTSQSSALFRRILSTNASVMTHRLGRFATLRS